MTLIVQPTDQVLRQGKNGPPIVWQFLKNDIPDDQTPALSDVLDFTGSTVVLTIYRGRKVFVQINSDDDADQLVIELATGKVTWTPPIATTRILPLGRVARYDLERRIGSTQEPLLNGPGYCIVEEGLDDDD